MHYITGNTFGLFSGIRSRQKQPENDFVKFVAAVKTEPEKDFKHSLLELLEKGSEVAENERVEKI